ncbi:TlyA family RNA methyltransferase [Chthonobacter rhizosphaerae]|uniref:TlyA family RNA methyltransferase n=1 Tax=Chthonobacter rhizosphaerae TaxID=2735553 RepID=UPI0015EF4FF7|nr:TlyA family RNA methyltransferase [Chthonobacter rhizosphaerae]
MTKTRLDQLLVSRGLAESRARARDAILRGTVTVDGRRAEKPGETVPDAAAVAIDDPAAAYVSRAALKLIAGLEATGFDPAGRRCLDVGASTGGFTQVLLERGAAHVTAVDVGHGQLHSRLAADPRVASLEGLNARVLTAEHVDGPVEAIVCDVSFISLTLALPPALSLAVPGAFGIFLIKPQFEAGREAIGKGGLVDPAVGRAAAERIAAWLGAQPGWTAGPMIPSPIEGGDGNLEYLIGATRDRA